MFNPVHDTYIYQPLQSVPAQDLVGIDLSSEHLQPYHFGYDAAILDLHSNQHGYRVEQVGTHPLEKVK